MPNLPPNATLRKEWPEACRMRVGIYEDPETGCFFVATRANAFDSPRVAEINGVAAVPYEEATAAAEGFYQALRATTPADLARAFLNPLRIH